jgi:DNA replication protein DnaC
MVAQPDSPPIISSVQQRPALSRERLLEIALQAFEEGAERQRAKRSAAGLPAMSEFHGLLNGLGMTARAVLEQLIRADEDTTPRPPTRQPADGQPYCPTCDGARFLAKRDAPGLSPEIVHCRACSSALEAQQREALARQAGLGASQRRKRFETFQHAKGAELAIAAAAQWSERWAVDPEPGDTAWLVISGERGSGKTHLGLAAANRLVDTLHAVRWFHTLDLVDMARSLYADGEAAVLRFRRELATCEALVLDEFGALSTAGTDFAVSRFVEPLLDQRYRESRPTLFTLKADPEAVRAHISDSIGRRMQDAEICLVVANDAPQWMGGKSA